MRKKITVLLCLLLVISSVKFVFGEDLANVNWYIEGDKLIIDLKAPVRLAYTSFTLSNPNRLVIDVYNATLPKSQSFEVNKSPVRILRMAPRRDRSLRITLEGSKIPKYYINLAENDLRLSIVVQLDISPVSTLLRKILYGNNRISIYTTSSCKFKSILDDNPPRFIMEFPCASFSGKIEGITGSGVINRVLAYDYEDINKNVNTIVVVELKNKIEPVITENKDQNIIQLDFARETQTVSVSSTRTTVTPAEQAKKVTTKSTEKRVSLSFKDADIKDVLQALSIKAGTNIVIDEGVSKRITLVLNNVTAKEALEIITKASGLAYEKWDNGYIVSTPKRLLEILDSGITREKVPVQIVEAIEIKSDTNQIQNTLKVVYPDIVTSITGKYLVLRGEKEKIEEAKKLIASIDVITVTPEIIAKTTETTERITLKHMEAKDFVESIKGLFPQDTFTIETPTNTIIVKGTRDIIDRVQEFVSAVDIPTPQYMLEAKVVEVNRDGALLLGIDSSLTGNVSVGLSTNALALESLTSLVTSTVQLNAVLNMAQSKGLAKVIAAPKIAAIDGKEANIFIGDVINYFIPNVQGGFDLRSVTAGVTLRVTAKMERDKTIRVTLNPEVSSITGWTGSGATIAPNVGTRRASTELKVKDGDTIIIGGLMRSSDTENVKKVPLLSNIPILGQLFKSRDTKQEERELIIMITVNVVKEEK